MSFQTPRSPTDETNTLLPNQRRPLRGLCLRPLRRRRMPTVRLGGRRGWLSGGTLVPAFLRRLRLRLLISQHLKAIKRIRSCYSGLMKDIVDGPATMESVQARMMMETYFAVPIMPVSFGVGNYLK